ncbi:hypothetical protein [Pseudarthrobacter sp. LMD1-1-1.1]|uniref:hypothetical protein n=1 Tax=Pseudarthrobacter sp. LMD1-1-1.1 TaxID=3135242 RepID=UPI0034475027
MNPCECTDTRQMVICALNRGDGPCLATTAPEAPETSSSPEPYALNSDALTNSIAAKLGATINQ